MRLKKTRLAIGLAAIGLIASVARAEDEVVRIELRSGERVEGALEGYGSHVYKVRVNGALRELKDDEIAKLVFLGAGEAAALTSACPTCGKIATGTRCPDDNVLLVRSDLVVLHEALSMLAKAEPEPGFENPFARVVRPDGTVDGAALERLVADYRLASKASAFGKYAGKFPLGWNRRAENLVKVVQAIKQIVQAENLFYKTSPSEQPYALIPKLAKELEAIGAPELVGGRAHGYTFSVLAPPNSSYYAVTGFPVDPAPGSLYFFWNSQLSSVYVADRPFSIGLENVQNLPSGVRALDEKELWQPRAAEPQASPSPAPRPKTTLDDFVPEEELKGLRLVTRSAEGAIVIEKELEERRASLAEASKQAEFDGIARKKALRWALECDLREGATARLKAFWAMPDAEWGVKLEVWSWASAEAARKGASALRQRLVEDRDNVFVACELVTAGTLAACLHHQIVDQDAVASVRGHLIERLTRAGSPVVETVYRKERFDMTELEQLGSKLPPSLTAMAALDASDLGKVTLPGFTVRGAPAHPHYGVRFKGASGSVVVLYFPWSLSSNLDAIIDFRAVWNTTRETVTLAVEGKVPEDAVAWVTARINATLNDCEDTKAAQALGLVAMNEARATVCANRLKQIALAAQQYVSDKRYFPHEGDFNTNLKAVDLLFKFNYLDDPSVKTCPCGGNHEGFPVAKLPASTTVRPIVWDSAPHVDGKRTVAFTDGHTAVVDAEEFEKLLIEATKPVEGK